MEQLTLQLYSLLLALALLLVSPMLLFIPKTRAGLKQKLGLIDEFLTNSFSRHKNAIWIHAVSVGEFNGVYPLILAIKNKYPNIPLIVSTTTQAGQLLAKQRANDIAQIIYFPFDLPWIVNRFLGWIEPSLIIVFETELWPNFINACWHKNIPVAILNARMSPRSFKRYKLARKFFGPILKKLSLIGAQSHEEGERYKAVGGNNLPIEVFGNLKYDWPALFDHQAIADLKIKLGIQQEDFVLIAGSTHAEEEKIILNICKKLSLNAAVKNLRVIIAPRHPERFASVAKLIENAGFNPKRHSQGAQFSKQNDVYLLDTIGQLANFYSVASLAFVGGTIAKIGGHNLLEPYLYGVPVVCGPHLFKTKETAMILNHAKALFIGSGIEELENKLLQLIQDEQLRKIMGANGQLWLSNNRGAVVRSLDYIELLLRKNSQNKLADKNVKVEMITQ